MSPKYYGTYLRIPFHIETKDVPMKSNTSVLCSHYSWVRTSFGRGTPDCWVGTNGSRILGAWNLLRPGFTFGNWVETRARTGRFH
jgi:hypothetical protein